MPMVLKRTLFLILIFNLYLGAESFPSHIKTLRITFSKETPLRNRPPQQTHKKQIVKYFDLENNSVRTETHPYGEWPTAANTQVEIIDPQTTYDVQFGKPIILRKRNRTNSPSQTWKHINLSHLEEKEYILGRECSVSSNGGGWRFWLWNGILLKEEKKKRHGIEVTMATLIEENPFIDPQLMDMKHFTQAAPDGENPQSPCRLDKMDGTNITRKFYENRDDCLVNICDQYGRSQAKKGISSQCVFKGEVIKKYRKSNAHPKERFKTRKSPYKRYRSRHGVKYD